MANLGKVVYLTAAEYSTLIANGTVTLASGTAVTYSANDIYIVPDVLDTTPTANSTNSVTSGGVKTYVDNQITTVNNKFGDYVTTTEGKTHVKKITINDTAYTTTDGEVDIGDYFESVTQSGTGNVITAVTENADGKGITVTKGMTAAASGSTTSKATTGITAALSATPTFTGTAHTHKYSKTTSAGSASVLKATSFDQTSRNFSFTTQDVITGITNTDVSTTETTAGGTVSKPAISITDTGHTHTIQEVAFYGRCK